MGKTTSDVFAREWVQAWNRRDLESLLSHYADDVEFRSPLAAKLLGGTSGVVRGKQNLRGYFTKALAAFPGDLGIELLGVYDGVESVVVHFQARGRRGAEFMEMDNDGLVRRALAHLQAEAPR
jgi:ketosteroid isomerase-like protein